LSTQRLLGRFDRPVILFPCYQTIASGYLPHLSPLRKPKTFEKFSADMEFLLRHFRPVDADDLWLHTTGEKRLTKNVFHLTFDTELKEFYELVLPYLHRKGIPATLFVTGQWSANTHLFYRHKAALIIDALARKNPSPAALSGIQALLKPASLTGPLPEQIRTLPYDRRDVLDDIACRLDLNFDHYVQRQRPYLSHKQFFDLQKKGITFGGALADPALLHLPENELITHIMQSLGAARHIDPGHRRFFAFPLGSPHIPDSTLETLYRKNKRGTEIIFDTGGIGTRHDGRYISRLPMDGRQQDAPTLIHRHLLNHLA
jgi:hypothetical protein